MGRQRKLTAGEIELARTAFDDKIEYDKVRLSDGPGTNPMAHMAFAKGNPAITIGNTIYFKKHFCPDFSVRGENGTSFMHEMAHVWQYRTLGMPAFYMRYAAEVAQAGLNPDKMYDYKDVTNFDDAMLEAQAQMVGHYYKAKAEGNASKTAELAKKLAGSGLFRL
ncbi:MAG TPA: DUF4157 domain-containing protein [Allosphingosinicella sp.]|jgi:hypothetical protein